MGNRQGRYGYVDNNDGWHCGRAGCPICAGRGEHLPESVREISDEPVISLDNFNFEKRTPPSLFSGRQISDTAKSTCDTIFLGFEMTTSQNILLHGDLEMAYYGETVNAMRIKKELDDNRQYWMSNKASVMFKRFKTLDGLLDAVKNKDEKEIVKIYYKAQYQHVLGESASQFEVPIYINKSNLNEKWVPSINIAIKCINTATPGLRVYETYVEVESKICFQNNEQDPEAAWTQTTPSKVYICLGRNWQGDFAGTATHELLHALGFKHEMQRWDADVYLDFDINEDNKYAGQYRKLEIGALTRFDPFSVLMYPENATMKRKDGDPIWRLKPSPNQLQELSELNKVALNLVYEPVVSDIYKPKLSKQTGMLYCGRKVMSTHNQCSPPTTDNYCGPNNWANCPACRVIKSIMSETTMLPEKIKTIERCVAKNKWQGLSGLFYCGERYSSRFYCTINGVQVHNDGICGCDNGIPCTDCGKALFPDYRWQQCNPSFPNWFANFFG